jgi:hypothetical protein
VVKDATPFVSVPVPRVVVPSRNVTVPVGVPPLEVTFAVSVTAAAAAAGFGLADNVVVVATGAAAFTASDTAVDVLASSAVLPA